MSIAIVKRITGEGKLARKLKELAALRITANIGFLGGATYDNGQSVAMVAYYNEYGRGNNPPRPFMKRTVEQNSGKWARGIKNNLRQTGVSRESVARAFDMAGQVAVGDVKRTIADWSPYEPRANSKKTIMRKAKRGRKGKGLVAIEPERALIDTGRMIGAVGYEVKV